MSAKDYSAFEPIRGGRLVEIRALSPEDRPALEDVISRASTKSLYRRFFTIRRKFTEGQAEFFVNVDFIKHVALVAVADEKGQPAIIGGGRYVLVQPGKAEVAFFVIDEYQGQGIGGILMRHLAMLARQAGIKELVAEVLSENRPMLKVFERSGSRTTKAREGDVIHLTLHLD